MNIIYMKTQVTDLMHSVRIFKLPSDDFRNRWNKFMDTLPKRTTLTTKEYLRGYRDAKVEHWYQDNLDFRYTVDNKLVSTNKSSPLYYEKHGFTVRDLSRATSSGHYWIGSDKPFFASPTEE